MTKPHDMWIEGTERMTNELINATWPGVQTMIDLRPRHTEAPVGNARDRGHTRIAVLNCTQCDDGCVSGKRGVGRTPMQWTARELHDESLQVLPPNAAKIVVIAPVDAWEMVRITLRPMRPGHVAYIPPVACELDSARWPNQAEVTNCMGHVLDQLWTANATGVLLVGRTATNLWRNDLVLARDAGKLGVLWGQYVTTAIEHPETVKTHRGGHGWAQWKAPIRGLVDAVAALDGGGDEAMRVWVESTRKCVECGGAGIDWIDPDGLAWCREHRNERWLEARQRTQVGAPEQKGLW